MGRPGNFEILVLAIIATYVLVRVAIWQWRKYQGDHRSSTPGADPNSRPMDRL
jgi:hypothetical protein